MSASRILLDFIFNLLLNRSTMETEYRHSPELDKTDRIAMRTIEESALWRRDPSARRCPESKREIHHAKD
ncbi:MAG: hypothetical protein EOS77_02440 [Mesorhizobium sp.]|nr:MAG: hypothetical protein EOS77_02440 [Mesorhizobium sp.]